jgi:hypothetical protein
MTWKLRRAVAMALPPITLLLITGFMGGAAPALALELGALRAVPGHAPPYIFRIPLVAPPLAPPIPATVTVRQPPDARASVKQHLIELYLRTLTDVELEVGSGGQTLNRLVLKHELQAARLQVESAPIVTLAPAVKLKSRERPSSEASPPPPAPALATDRSLTERELESIRQEIHSLVAAVRLWEEEAPRHELPAGDVISTAGAGALGGFSLVAVTALGFGYLRQRRAIARQRRRQAALLAMLRRRQARLAAAPPLLPAPQSTSRLSTPAEAMLPVAVRRRVQVAQKTRQRVRMVPHSPTPGLTQAATGEAIRLQTPTIRRLPSAAAELLDALAQLRGELMRLQGRATTSSSVDRSTLISPPAARSSSGTEARSIPG